MEEHPHALMRVKSEWKPRKLTFPPFLFFHLALALGDGIFDALRFGTFGNHRHLLYPAGGNTVRGSGESVSRTSLRNEAQAGGNCAVARITPIGSQCEDTGGKAHLRFLNSSSIMISFALRRTRSFKSGSFIAGGFNFSWSSGVSRGKPTSRRTSIRASWSVSSSGFRFSGSDNSVWAWFIFVRPREQQSQSRLVPAAPSARPANV